MSLINQLWGENSLQYITDPDEPTLFATDPFHFWGPRRWRLIEREWPGLFRDLVLPQLPVAKIAARFDPRMGRPTKELHAVLGALILQQMLDLTTEETVREFAFDERWHYALNLREDGDAEKYVSERTLRNYHRALLELDLAPVLFATITDALLKAFKVDTRKQRLDSTHIQSNMRRLGRIRLFGETIHKFLRELKRKHRERFKQLDEGLLERHLREGEGDWFGRTKPSQAERTLKKLAKDLLLLVLLFKDDEKVSRMASYRLLARLLEEQCEVIESDDEGEGEARVEVKPPQEVKADSLQNPSDPDATYDRHKGKGYQVQIMETYQPAAPSNDDNANSANSNDSAHDTDSGNDSDTNTNSDNDGDKVAHDCDTKRVPNLITHVAVEPAHHYDGEALQPALESTCARGCCPEELEADTHYGSDENVEIAKKLGVELIAPAAGTPSEERFSLADFEVDSTSGEIVACPEGEKPVAVETRTNSRTGERTYIAIFDLDVCMSCPSHERCPKQWPEQLQSNRVEVIYTTKQLRLAARRRFEKTRAFREKYRWRAGIEATASQYKAQTGAGRLRVRGLPAVTLAEFLKALGLNILRCAAAQSADFALQGGKTHSFFCVLTFRSLLLGITRSWRGLWGTHFQVGPSLWAVGHQSAT